MTEDPPGADPLVTPMPAFDDDEAVAIAERHFGKAGSVTELGGERDQNFRIETEEAPYLLKISNPADGPDDLDLQNEAMRHAAAADPDLPVMEPIQTVDGADWASVEDESGQSYLVRLFPFFPGRNAEGHELDRAALEAFGRDVARVGRALRGFFHPAAEYDILWDLELAPALRPLLDCVEDDDRRALAENVLDRYDETVEPVTDRLRAQVVHNDLTLGNVLLDDRDRVSGVLDFGDLTHTALVNDLAIAVASVTYRRDDPIEAAEAVVRGYVDVTPLEDQEARLLGTLVMTRMAAWGVIVAWRLAEHPEKTDHTAGGVDDGWEMLRRLESMGPERVSRRLRNAARERRVPYRRMETTELQERRRATLGSSPLFYDNPVHIVAGDGPWLYDPEGRRYLDAYNNVQVVGHGNTRVADAISGQAHTLTTHSRYLHESVAALGERLLETTPDELDRVILVNSGSEANDLAWRMSTAASGNGGALATDDAYHGITEATMAFSPESWPGGEVPSHVERVRPPIDPAKPGAEDAVGSVETAIDTLESQGTGLAAFIYDAMLTSDGIHLPDSDRMRRVADRVRDAGGLIVADEVQSGHGRIGSDFWAFQATDVVPDFVTMGKPMGNGHPVAAVVTRSELAERVRERTGMFSTFGGNPVSAVAAHAVLDEIEDRDLLAHTEDVGGYFRSQIRELADEHPIIGDVRGRGLMVGVELVTDRDAWTPATEATSAVVNGLRDRQILTNLTGSDLNVLKVRPPLVFERRHADRFVEALDDVLADLD